MNQTMWGALAMSAFVAGLFFLRFWQVSGDRLFLFLCLTFEALCLANDTHAQHLSLKKRNSRRNSRFG